MIKVSLGLTTLWRCKFYGNNSFNGQSLFATEFVYPTGPDQGKLRLVDGNTGKTVGTYYFPKTSGSCLLSVDNALVVTKQIGSLVESCGFIKPDMDGCVFSHKEYTLSSAIAADCTLFSVGVTHLGASYGYNIADAELYKKEQITDSGKSVEVLSKVNADILIGQDYVYIRKASTYPIEANTHVIKLIGKVSGTY